VPAIRAWNQQNRMSRARFCCRGVVFVHSLARYPYFFPYLNKKNSLPRLNEIGHRQLRRSGTQGFSKVKMRAGLQDFKIYQAFLWLRQAYLPRHFFSRNAGSP
jgi:hypothetical protein